MTTKETQNYKGAKSQFPVDEPELPLDVPPKKENPNKIDGIGNFMYNELMETSRRQDDIAERARDWLLRINSWYSYVMLSLLALYLFYSFASRNSETKARIYRLEHATGL
jgi:hypothetical protein